MRRPDIVVKHGWSLLQKGILTEAESKKISTLPFLYDDIKFILNRAEFTVYEQVLIAALDIGESRIAIDCLQPLSARFPDSVRVQRSRGMILEADGKYDEAIALYDGILEKQPSNLLILKRRACIFKAKGAVAEAIDEMNKILQLNSSDPSTWQELADMYLAECDYEAAAFCVEEAVLLVPTSAHTHCRLAEVYYSIGNYIFKLFLL